MLPFGTVSLLMFPFFVKFRSFLTLFAMVTLIVMIRLFVFLFFFSFLLVVSLLMILLIVMTLFTLVELVKDLVTLFEQLNQKKRKSTRNCLLNPSYPSVHFITIICIHEIRV